MERETVTAFLDACHEAARILKLLPELPHGVTPRQLEVLDAIQKLAKDSGRVRVSDVSAHLGVSRPGMTRLLGEMEETGFLEKQPDGADKRVVWLRLTALGEEYYSFYVYRYHTWLAGQFRPEDAERLLAAADTIHYAYQVMAAQQMDLSGKPALPLTKKTGE